MRRGVEYPFENCVDGLIPGSEKSSRLQQNGSGYSDDASGQAADAAPALTSISYSVQTASESAPKGKQMLVKNLNGTSDKKCPYRAWARHWYTHSGAQNQPKAWPSLPRLEPALLSQTVRDRLRPNPRTPSKKSAASKSGSLAHQPGTPWKPPLRSESTVEPEHYVS